MLDLALFFSKVASDEKRESWSIKGLEPEEIPESSTCSVMQGPDEGWSCQPDQATCTGQQGIKVLRRAVPVLRDSMNGDQEQGNTVQEQQM